MDAIDAHFARLKDAVPQAKLTRRPDGTAVVLVSDVRLPGGWSSATTAVQFIVPVGYPAARPDSFWADAALRLATGAMPSNAQMNGNNPPTQPLLWFSFHPTSWNPLKDDLLTYFNIVRTRFREVR
jgi:hypothetical protein